MSRRPGHYPPGGDVFLHWLYGSPYDDFHVKKLAAALSKLIGGTILAIAIISLIVSVLASQSFLGVFKNVLFWGGLALIIVSVGVGTGFSDVAYHRSHLMVVSGTYRQAMMRDRLQRRNQQFALMIVGVGVGLGLMGLTVLLGSIGM